MSVMKIAGKTANGLVKGVAVEDNGQMITSKKWETENILALEATGITTADAITNLSNVIDLSEYGIVSLRINYKMPGTALAIGFYSDITENGTVYMRDKNNENIRIELPASSDPTVVIITPDDFQYLPYLRYLKVRAKPEEAPTSEGYVKIYAMVKR